MWYHLLQIWNKLLVIHPLIIYLQLSDAAVIS